MGFVIERAKFGKPEDFFDLWAQLVESQQAMGGDTMASGKTEDFFRMLFAEYTSGRLPGVALLAVDGGEAVGALLWGAVPVLPVEPVNPKAVYGWGAFTSPTHRRQGVSKALRERAILDLDVMGVEVVTGSVLLSNPGGCESSRSIGFKPTQILGNLDVREEAQRILSPDDCGAGHVEGFYWQGNCPLCGRDG